MEKAYSINIDFTYLLRDYMYNFLIHKYMREIGFNR